MLLCDQLASLYEILCAAWERFVGLRERETRTAVGSAGGGVEGWVVAASEVIYGEGSDQFEVF